MATATRLYTPTRASVNQGNQLADSIDYRVTGQTFAQTKAAVLARAPIDGLPAIFTGTHPDMPGLICRQHVVEPLGGGENAKVTALFATSNWPGAGLLRATTDVSGGQFVLSGTFEEVPVRLPYCVPHKYDVIVDGDVIQSKRRWKVKTGTVAENRWILRAKWQIDDYLDINDMNGFAEQSNRLHEINGKTYRYRVGSITPLSNFAYEVNATWEYDPGTTRVLNGGSSDLSEYLMAQDLPYMPGEQGNPDLVRDPFHTLNVIPAEDPDAPLDQQASRPRLSQIPSWEMGDIREIPGVPFP